jgi:hypothetical protein
MSEAPLTKERNLIQSADGIKVEIGGNLVNLIGKFLYLLLKNRIFMIKLEIDCVCPLIFPQRFIS